MPGTPTKFVVADQVLQRLIAAGGAEADLLKKAENLPYFYLGAIGATFGDLLAARTEPAGAAANTPYFNVWLPVLSLFAGTPQQGTTPASAGIYQDLKQLRDTGTKLYDIINKALAGNAFVKDKQKIALLNSLDELNALPDVITDLKTYIGAITSLRLSVGQSIFNSGPSPKSPPSTGWQVRDTLHGSHTGQFLSALETSAADDFQRAYALGAKIGYATDLCGNPFVNSVVGGPYRNDWWRHRWICNSIDTWVHGFYGLGGAGSVLTPASGIPKPLYTNWPNVCEASLHKKIELPGLDVDAFFAAVRDQTPVPAALPQTFVDFWKAAYGTAHGSLPGAIDDAGVQSAYGMTWFILWLQTSGEVLPCIPSDRINYPDGCSDRPLWVAVDGSVTTGNSKVAKPPKPSRDTDPSVPEVISGIVLAILAVAEFVGGVVAGGVATIIAAAALIADGETDPDWQAFHCYVGWTLAFQNNLTNALHDLLTATGLAFPYTADLAHNDIVFTASGVITPPSAALNTALSRGRIPPDSQTPPPEPASRWLGPSKLTSNWANFPTEPPELPSEYAYPTVATWPSHFVDGMQPTPPPAGSPSGTVVGTPIQVNPSTSLVLDQEQFKVRRGTLNDAGSVTTFFGNAVDVSMELISKKSAQPVLDWDLDGDPGIGYPTWQLPTPASPRSASVPEP